MNSPFSKGKEAVKTVADQITHESEKTPEENENVFRLPILIFPGFMSSTLVVKQSPIKVAGAEITSDTWEGKRVWLNVASAGFGSIHWGSALRANELLRENGEHYNEAMHEQYERELECKNRWLQHLRLSSDMVTEPSGIQVRSMEGLEAVDFLVPGGALAKHISWVFLPVINMLQKAGYQDGINLDAAPYDWRIPPCTLESRDQYFTKTMRQVEKMYTDNNDTPVVLLCHSMGCKTCHYFLNFCLQEAGQEWIDKYVHSYMPVGAPHLGSPKAIRATVDGDKMGLETFLSDEEGLICGRSFGSVPWMYPTRLPEYNAPPNAFLKREGSFHVEILGFDCTDMLFRKRVRAPNLRLSISFGKETLHSKFHENFTSGCSETFIFAAPPDLPGSDDKLQIKLQEPLLWRARKRTGWGRVLAAFQDALHFVCCGKCRCLGVPCVAAHTTVGMVTGVAMAAADVAATEIIGATHTLAATEQKDLSGLICASEVTEVPLSLVHVDDIKKTNLDDARTVQVKVRVRWEPPQHDVDTTTLPLKIDFAIPSNKGPQLEVEHVKDKQAHYESVNGVQLYRSEWLTGHRRVIAACYQPDPLGPRSHSSEGAPPVKRVKAVYGINLPTEVGAVYHRCSVVAIGDNIRKRHTLDTKTRFSSPNGYTLKDGVILETKETPQIILGSGEEVQRSGDGTVPYWSLQQCRAWQDACDVTVDEIEGAEHREILEDKRFHKILLDHVMPESSSSAVLQRNESIEK